MDSNCNNGWKWGGGESEEEGRVKVRFSARMQRVGEPKVGCVKVWGAKVYSQICSIWDWAKQKRATWSRIQSCSPCSTHDPRHVSVIKAEGVQHLDRVRCFVTANHRFTPVSVILRLSSSGVACFALWQCQHRSDMAYAPTVEVYSCRVRLGRVDMWLSDSKDCCVTNVTEKLPSSFRGNGPSLSSLLFTATFRLRSGSDMAWEGAYYTPFVLNLNIQTICFAIFGKFYFFSQILWFVGTDQGRFVVSGNYADSLYTYFFELMLTLASLYCVLYIANLCFLVWIWGIACLDNVSIRVCEVTGGRNWQG